jgi:hypothetical protein
MRKQIRTEKKIISTELDGVTYKGTYYTESGCVIVHSRFGQKATQIGGSPADMLAEIMLMELVGASQSKT